MFSNLTEQQKGAAIKLHVSQEFYIFDICYKRLNEKMEDPDLRIYLESFLLHARNLFDFLCTEKRYGDDISVVDFSAGYFKISETEVPITKINKQLSHITYSRLKPEDLFEKRMVIYKTIRDSLAKYNEKVIESYQVTI